MVKIEAYKNKVTGLFNGSGERISLEDFIEEYTNSYLYGDLGFRSIHVEVKEKENSICLTVWSNYNQIDSVLFGIGNKEDINEIANLLKRIKDYLNENIHIDYFD